MVALSTGVLTKAGGTFTLLADVDFGTGYGLKSAYYKSRGTTSTTGILRLASLEGIGWRNAANGADILLATDASDNLLYNGNPLISLALGAADTVLRMDGAGTAVGYAKLVDANIASAAGIAVNKLAALTVSRALVSDGSGFVSAATTTATQIGYLSAATGTTGTTTTNLVYSTSPTLVTPTLGVASATSINKVIFTTPATGSTLTIADGKTLTASNTLTFTGTDSTSFAFPSGSSTVLTLASVGTITGAKTFAQTSLLLQDNSTNAVTLSTTNSTTSHTLKLPAAQGAASTVLTNDGSGNLTWAATVSNSLNQYNTYVGNSSNIATSVDTNLLGNIKGVTQSATVTITIATPGVVTDTAHGFATGDKIYLTTSGALPTGLTVSTTYYIVKIDANSYSLATSLDNALAATKITTSGSQSGTHSRFGGGLTIKTLNGSLTGASAGAGLVGETLYGPSNKNTGGLLTLASATVKNLQTLTLSSAGIWLISAQAQYAHGDNSTTASTTFDFTVSSVSSSSMTGAIGNNACIDFQSIDAANPGSDAGSAHIKSGYLSFVYVATTNQQLWLNCQVTFTGSVPSARGGFQAVRIG